MQPEVERFGNAEPCCGKQPEQRSVDLPSMRVRLTKPTSRSDKLYNLLRCVDVGQTSSCGRGKRIGWHLVGRILGVQEASQACDVSHPDVMRMRGRGPCRPVHDGGNADMFIAPIRSESGECTEIHRQVVKLVPEGLAKRDIAFSVGN